MLFQQKNQDLQTVYGRDNTKQARMPYFHCGPFKKKAKQEKKIKRKERLGSSKSFIRSNSKGKASKKGN